MFRRTCLLAIALRAALPVFAQEGAVPPQQPQVKVHMLNVCTPSADEQQEIATALAHIPRRPSFSPDFEVDRGRSVLDASANPLAAGNPAAAAGSGSAVADFVRVRHELKGAGTYSSVQYSFSRDREQMVETLVFRVRDPKDLLQVSIDDSASAVTSPVTMLSSSTPAARVRLERFGKQSVVLARCSASPNGPPPDQSAYEPLFASASSILTEYRGLLGAKSLIPDELARIRRSGNAAKTRIANKAGAPKHK